MTKEQIATDVEPGLKAAVIEQARLEGLNMSIIVRKALMRYLDVDATGVPLGKRVRRG